MAERAHGLNPVTDLGSATVAVKAAPDNPPTKPCPTCDSVVIDAKQVECSRCADMPRLAREIEAFEQPDGGDQ